AQWKPKVDRAAAYIKKLQYADPAHPSYGGIGHGDDGPRSGPGKTPDARPRPQGPGRPADRPPFPKAGPLPPRAANRTARGEARRADRVEGREGQQGGPRQRRGRLLLPRREQGRVRRPARRDAGAALLRVDDVRAAALLPPRGADLRRPAREGGGRMDLAPL